MTKCQQFKVLCFGCADWPSRTTVEQVYSWGGEADEENASESGRSGQGKDTKPSESAFRKLFVEPIQKFRSNLLQSKAWIKEVKENRN